MQSVWLKSQVLFTLGVFHQLLRVRTLMSAAPGQSHALPGTRCLLPAQTACMLHVPLACCVSLFLFQFLTWS